MDRTDVMNAAWQSRSQKDRIIAGQNHARREEARANAHDSVVLSLGLAAAPQVSWQG